MLYVEFMVINKNDKFISKLLTGFDKKFEYRYKYNYELLNKNMIHNKYF